MFPPGSAIDATHVAADSGTIVRKLDDRIPENGQIESIGDVLLDLGDSLAFPFLGLAAILVVIKNDPNKNK